ncbi:MAG: ABC transporter permease subunit [Bacillota bacterium]|nr:ABC transporter permease subunit [Bacillota bacterium]
MAVSTDTSALPLRKINKKSFLQRLVIQRWLILMALPAFALVLVFHYFPIYGILIAFKDYSVAKGVWASDWAGLKHFRLFLNNPLAARLFTNTVRIGASTLLFTFPAPIILALLLNEINSTVYKRFVQSISYIPHFISAVVIVGILTNFSSRDGLFNAFRELLGLKPVLMMASTKFFVPLYVGSAVWQGVGWGTIIYLAALTGIDPTLYDVASIDGANRWHKMRYISLPAIKPTTTILLILSLRGILGSDFEKILLMQNDANRSVADVINTYVYREGIQGARFEYSTAVSLFLSVISFVIVISANYLSRKVSENSLW